MELGFYTFGDVHPDPHTGEVVSAGQRIRDVLERIRLAEEVGLHYAGIGEHHRRDYAISAPATVMAAALAVSVPGFMLAQQRPRPLLARHYFWPSKSGIDLPLVTGAALFGVGWGLVGLCPGPALESLATLSPGVIVFVVAMAAGMVFHDLWQKSQPAIQRSNPLAGAADG